MSLASKSEAAWRLAGGDGPVGIRGFGTVLGRGASVEGAPAKVLDAELPTEAVQLAEAHAAADLMLSDKVV